MAYYPDEPQRPKDPPTQMAIGLGIAAAGLMAAMGAKNAGLVPLWQLIVEIAGYGCFVGGVVYMLTTLAEWVVLLWLDISQIRDGQQVERPSGEVGRPDVARGDTEVVEAAGRVTNGRTTQPDMLLDQLRIRLQQEADWFDRVDWQELAAYVATEPEPQFSRVALVPIVPARVYSRYNEEDITFPEAMVWMDMAREIETNNYQWTGRGKRIMREIHNDFQRDLSPTPAAVYGN